MPSQASELRVALVAEGPTDRVESDPTLPGFDLFVLHLDADVAGMKYADCGAPVEGVAQRMPPLPCSHPCPPPGRTVDELRQRLLAWLGIARLGPKTVLCVPSKAVDAWLAAGILEPSHPLLANIECNLQVESGLASLPKAQRIHKSKREYQARAHAVTGNWAAIARQCSQAARFGSEVMALVPKVDISRLSETLS